MGTTGMGLKINQVNEGLSVDPSQTRSASRIRIQIPVFVRGSDAAGIEFIELTKTLNISAKGACIASVHHLRLDQVVQLTIPAPAPSSPSLIPSETPPIMARIRRQDAVGDLKLFGLEFLRPLE
jgi:PilZ domain